MAENDFNSAGGFFDKKLGLHIDATSLCRDVYQLKCIFEASPSMSSSEQNQVNGEHFATQIMITTFEISEISRLMISISISGRLLEEKLLLIGKHGLIGIPHEEMTGWHERCVGDLIKDVNNPSNCSLTLSEAYNKVIHATKMNTDTIEGSDVFQPPLNPILHLYGQRWNKDWKATLDVYAFLNEVFKVGTEFMMRD